LSFYIFLCGRVFVGFVVGSRIKFSFYVSVVSVFAALHAVLAAVPGVWRSLVIMIVPVEGVVLGPKAGFLAALIGAGVGRVLRPRPGLDPVFGVGEAVGAACSGLAFKGMWRRVLLLYVLMLAAYFLHPVGRRLPAWCLWDVYVALALVPLSGLLARRISDERENPQTLTPNLALSAFIGVEADVLTRIFIFIPLGFYALMGVPEGALPAIWVAGAVETPIESVISVVASTVVGVPLLIALERGRLLRWPLT